LATRRPDEVTLGFVDVNDDADDEVGRMVPSFDVIVSAPDLTLPDPTRTFAALEVGCMALGAGGPIDALVFVPSRAKED